MPPEPLGETSSRLEPEHPSDPSDSSTESAADGLNGETPFSALRDALGKLAELKAYAREYFAAKGDQARLMFRRGLILGAAFVVAGLIFAASLCVAVVLLFLGLAEVITAGLGGRAWAGNLIIGGAFLLLVILGTAVILAKFLNGTRRTTVAKYERRQQEQRERFGRSSRDRAAAAGKVEI